MYSTTVTYDMLPLAARLSIVGPIYQDGYRKLHPNELMVTSAAGTAGRKVSHLTWRTYRTFAALRLDETNNDHTSYAPKGSSD